jgi:putative Holliday junction resolvase
VPRSVRSTWNEPKKWSIRPSDYELQVLAMGCRVLGIDVGRRRIGLAISDRTRTLARPLATLQVRDDNAVDVVAAEIQKVAAEEDGLALIVVGVPRRLDGSADEETPHVAEVIGELKKRTAIPIVEADERLTSREAESRLALRERDWKKRKARLDQASAAVILQDYLDWAPKP